MGKFKKIILLINILILSVALFGGCGKKISNATSQEPTATVYPDNSEAGLVQNIYSNASLNKLLEDADDVVDAVVNSVEFTNRYYRLEIEIKSTIRGNAAGKMTVLYTDTNIREENGVKTDKYEVGKEYVFLLQHIKDVYWDRYVMLSSVYIPCDKPELGTVRGNKPEDIDNIVTYVKTYKFETEKGVGESLSTYYIESDDIKKIVTECDAVFVLEPFYLDTKNETSDIFYCNIIESLNGADYRKDTQVLVPFLKDTVEVEKQYIVCIFRETTDATMFTLAARNAVFEIDRKSEIQEIIAGK